MQESNWKEVLKRIPSSYYEGLSMITSAGIELIVQSIFRMEDMFLVLRGRTAGSNDAGKLLIVPYERITYLSFAKTIPESDVDEIFGATKEASASSGDSEEAAEGVADKSGPVAEDSSGAYTKDAKPINREYKESKALLLAKLRERLGGPSDNRDSDN